jgi:hypothetical protein
MAVITSIAIAAVAVGAGISAQHQASKSRRNQALANAEIAKLENARTRRNQIRDERIAQGTAKAVAATRGGGGGFGTVFSSGAQGERQSLTTQLRANLRFIDEASRLNTVASNFGIRASGKETQASIFQGIGSLALSAGSLFAQDASSVATATS